jgi:predicted nuclease with TOPRIM domain
MTQASEPEDTDLTRSLRRLDRRVSRLEDTQLTWRELNDSFNRVYEEIDVLEDQIDRRFDTLETSMNQRFDRLEGEVRELNGNFDIIMRHITGQVNYYWAG